MKAYITLFLLTCSLLFFSNRVLGLPRVVPPNHSAEMMLDNLNQIDKTKLKWGQRFLLKILQKRIKRKIKRDGKKQKKKRIRSDQETGDKKNNIFGVLSIFFAVLGLVLILGQWFVGIFALLLGSILGAISLIQIIINPEKYSGSKVEILSIIIGIIGSTLLLILIVDAINSSR